MSQPTLSIGVFITETQSVPKRDHLDIRSFCLRGLLTRCQECSPSVSEDGGR